MISVVSRLAAYSPSVDKWLARFLLLSFADHIQGSYFSAGKGCSKALLVWRNSVPSPRRS